MDVVKATSLDALRAALGCTEPGPRLVWPEGLWHENRVHAVGEVEDLDKLAVQLTQTTWTCCSGFAWRGLVLLNDATGADGAQEYAVFRSDTRERVESLTASWMSVEEFRGAMEQLDEDEGDRDMKAAWPDKGHGSWCRWCA